MKTSRLTRLALLVAVSLILSYIETFIPLPMVAPGIKIGLANISVLFALISLGFREGIIVGGMKSVIGGLFFGRPSSILYSLPATILSTVVMGLLIHINRERKFLSIVGISVLGSVAFNIMQLVMAGVIVSDFAIFRLIPVFMMLSIPTGVFIGVVDKLLVKRFDNEIDIGF